MKIKKIIDAIVITSILGSTVIASKTELSSKVDKINISGTHYLGFVSTKDSNGDITNGFETRRNYLQLKAYMNKKDYMRITLDTHQADDGEWNVRLKYAFLYIDQILPATGVEMGQAHRPWIDFEEHGGWNYRSINKVFFEDKQASHLNNSADLGINFKTKLNFFSSEVGLFNGEGYHNSEDGQGLSVEYRFTYHILKSGKSKRKSSLRYLDASTHGVYSAKDAKRGNKDWKMAAVHIVYNNPSLLVAAQYIKSFNEGYKYEGSGYSINSEIRPFGNKNFAIARYDVWEQSGLVEAGSHDDVNTIIAGIVNKYNKNVKFITSTKIYTYANNSSKNAIQYMLSAEVKY